ncbi:hypothetical protein F2P81_024213 [Scophthalmus maximus]|uniref:Uncharacterized protein n=1 Tax=Scophthalmus maximus TaxID=52904 RepID=A0A6A4RNX9_SCOMX|nr:hypothetical protein F2P81_024213 [Scophthalmus maximus]
MANSHGGDEVKVNGNEQPSGMRRKKRKKRKKTEYPKALRLYSAAPPRGDLDLDLYYTVYVFKLNIDLLGKAVFFRQTDRQTDRDTWALYPGLNVPENGLLFSNAPDLDNLLLRSSYGNGKLSHKRSHTFEGTCPWY